ncbi:MAG TPA: FG-GAP-like repeat-containing protein [Bacteroidota bacterium]|nr:FG-GAP-like repeat-containing protein [Bacteroidota bacterium]
MKLIVMLLAATISSPAWAAGPAITSFSPNSGSPGASVTIHGSGFDPTAAANIVQFGGAAAAVLSASATELVVTVPPGATYSPISVTTNRLTGYSGLPFTPTGSFRRILTQASFATPVNYATGGMMRMGTIADLDGDGKLDMIGTNDNNYLSIFLNISTPGTIGPSSFAAAVNVPTGYRPYFVAAGDLDGDGKIDLVSADNSSGTVTVLRNTSSPGGLSFKSLTIPVAYVPTAVAIADFDGDGRPDIVVSSNMQNAFVFKNTGRGDSLAFTLAATLTTQYGCLSLAAGDVDGDGLPDVVVANGSSTVSVFRNISTPGNVSFAPSVDITGFDNPWSVAIGDIDGDGRPDIAVGSYVANVVSVVRNTGTAGHISFGPSLDLAPGSLSWNIALGDVDGDGKADLVVPNTDLGTVAVFVNKSNPGSIAFEQPLTYATGNGSMSINIGDMDGDGIPDLVIGNFYSGQSIAVIRGTLQPHPVMQVAPDSLAFGWIMTGTADTMNLSVANGGSRDTLSVSSVTSSSAAFTVSPATLVVPPGSARLLPVIFKPTAIAFDTAQITIAGNDSATPVVHIPVSGHGYALGHAPIITRIGYPLFDNTHVQLVWFRTTDDSAGAADPAAAYSIWHRLPPGGSTGTAPAAHLPAGAAATGPPWEFDVSVPAITLDRYAAAVPVPVSPDDPWLVFMVVAETKGGRVYASAPDSIQDQPGVTSSDGSRGDLLPSRAALEQNFPNPFNPGTTIGYSLPQQSHVIISVHNTLGQQVAELVDGEVQAGYHEVRFDASNLASGIYFYRMRAGSFVQSRKLLLIR